MRYGALLALLFAFGCRPGLLYGPKSDPTTLPDLGSEDVDVISFTNAPHPLDTPVVCEDKPFSNLKCPFTLKRTIDFRKGFVEEQRCQCFPDVAIQRSILAETQTADLRNLAKAIRPLKEGNSCVYDMSFTELSVQKAGTEVNFLFSPADFKGCGGSATYVEAAGAKKLSDAMAELVKDVAPTSGRALRFIFEEHKGFRLSYPMSNSTEFPLCTVQSSFLYKAESRHMEVELCGGVQGMRSQTLELVPAEGERLMTSLKAIEAPSMGSSVKSCSVAPVELELHRADGASDTYYFNSPSCQDGWQARDDYRQHIFAPSAEAFLNIMSIYDNF